jgi:hypothetical protein
MIVVGRAFSSFAAHTSDILWLKVGADSLSDSLSIINPGVEAIYGHRHD